MKICLRSNIYYNVGVAETIYQYFLASKDLGIDFKIAGFIEEKVTNFIQPISKPLPRRKNEINLHGRDYPITKENSKDVDLFVFYFDSQNPFKGGDENELERILSIVPREKSIVIDADGKYNPLMNTGDDSNHVNETERQEWIKTFRALSDRIFQPTLNPLCKEVKPFTFWGYKEPREKRKIEHDVLYLGSNWYRWDRMEEFMKQFEGLRDLFPRLTVMGSYWLSSDPYMPNANKHNPNFFKENDIKVQEYVTEFGEFTEILSGSRFSPILIRPVLSKMKMITPRMFETFASGTIPFLPPHFDYCEELYGKEAKELIIDGDTTSKLRDMNKREERYKKITEAMGERLRINNSYEKRIDELIKIGNSGY